MHEENKLEENIETMTHAVNTLNITLCRVYDALMALVANADEETASMLEQAHDAGRFIGSPPSIGKDPFMTPE